MRSRANGGPPKERALSQGRAREVTGNSTGQEGEAESSQGPSLGADVRFVATL